MALLLDLGYGDYVMCEVVCLCVGVLGVNCVRRVLMGFSTCLLVIGDRFP